MGVTIKNQAPEIQRGVTPVDAIQSRMNAAFHAYQEAVQAIYSNQLDNIINAHVDGSLTIEEARQERHVLADLTFGRMARRVEPIVVEGLPGVDGAPWHG